MQSSLINHRANIFNPACTEEKRRETAPAGYRRLAPPATMQLWKRLSLATAMAWLPAEEAQCLAAKPIQRKFSAGCPLQRSCASGVVLRETDREAEAYMQKKQSLFLSLWPQMKKRQRNDSVYGLALSDLLRGRSLIERKRGCLREYSREAEMTQEEECNLCLMREREREMIGSRLERKLSPARS